MPLAKGKSKATVSRNISEMTRSGRPQDQAVAAALRIARESVGRKKKAGGGRAVRQPIDPAWFGEPGGSWQAGNKATKEGTTPTRTWVRDDAEVETGDISEPRLYAQPDVGRRSYLGDYLERRALDSVPYKFTEGEGNAKGGKIESALRIARAVSGKTDLPSSHPDYGHTTHERSFSHEGDTGAPAAAAEPPAHQGEIRSSVAGRTDHLPMNVRSGSHVLPADILSALGEGNTSAGFKVAKDLFAVPKWFKGLPYGAKGLPYGVTAPSKAAAGGQQGDEPFNLAAAPRKNVPIIAAGGEHVVSPEEVEYAAHRFGSDDRDDGHAIIDEFIKQIRKKNIKTLKKLPGPAKD